jgi:putative oxidoreductase
MKVLSGDFSFGDPIGIGLQLLFNSCAFAEFVAPILMIIGWKTRWFAFLLPSTMLSGFYHCT